MAEEAGHLRRDQTKKDQNMSQSLRFALREIRTDYATDDESEPDQRTYDHPDDAQTVCQRGPNLLAKDGV